MGRLLAIDYGLKRTGIAVTDPMKIIASPLETVATSDLMAFLKKYLDSEEVEAIVIGMPVDLRNNDTHVTGAVRRFIENFKKDNPGVPVHEVDERFTSKMAQNAMLAGGMKKKDRQKKENVDKISASIILQSFMERHQSF